MSGSRRSAPVGRLRQASFWTLTLAVGLGALIAVCATVVGFRLDQDPAMPASPAPSAVDVGFAQDMAIHHAQAVLMASEATLHASSNQVRLLAREILVQQSQETGMMRTWLSDWDMPQLPSGQIMAWMKNGQMTGMPSRASMTSSTPSGRMPGLATNRQLARLAAAKSKSFDHLFLKLMLRHHEGGIAMANYAAQHASLAQVRTAAGGMVIDQANECTLMQELLKVDQRQQ